MLTREILPGNGIVVDEAGIETGIWGRFRLKSAYQPIFRLQGEQLVPFAVEGRTLPCLEGNAVPPALFQASVTAHDRARLGRVGRQLHFGNLDNVGQSGLALFAGLDAEAFADPAALSLEIEDHAQRLGETGIAASSAVFVFRGHGATPDRDLAAIAAIIHGFGMRVCFEESGAVFSAPALLSAVAPDFMRVSVDRLRPLTNEPTTQRMLKTMFGALAERGITVLATGTEGPEDFVSALDAGCVCFQGTYLARPGLAGSVLALAPLDVEGLQGLRDNVVSLFGQIA